MNGTHAATHDYFRKATAAELRLILRIIDENELTGTNFAVLVSWVHGHEPALPATRVISILQEIAERRR